ncbi:hypothetical protein G8C92_10520 [Paenibacillus donghaensis]|uniref:hypothetical protein n=1 Tax=Paenibacillus donghaensis TaxID=414771 RepID=UPI00188464F1|nr:hypothetical protein [Paenibacillus donghaensis]MBE9914464.1 hypothetical protein [Paenibacillus donghaensis]
MNLLNENILLFSGRLNTEISELAATVTDRSSDRKGERYRFFRSIPSPSLLSLLFKY